MTTDYPDAILRWRVTRDRVKRYHDPDLLQPAIDDRRARMTAYVDNQIAQTAELARTRASVATTPIDNATRAASKIGTASERESAWRRVTMLLEAGRKLGAVISETGDPLTLSAIAEWGPVWIRSQIRTDDDPTTLQQYSAEQLAGYTPREPDTEWIVPAVVDRLAEVGADPLYQRAVDARAEAHRHQVWADVLGDLATTATAAGPHAEALHRLDDGESYGKVSGALFPSDPNADRSPLDWGDLVGHVPNSALTFPLPGDAEVNRGPALKR